MEEKESNEQICLAWRHLSITVPKSLWSAAKPIVRQVSGCVTYHSLTAFLGPSGAGKTTLLKYLSGNHQTGLERSSELYLSREEKDGKLQVGFIEQHVNEMLVANMSVGEALRYAFRFKNRQFNQAKMEEHIETILEQLLLNRDLLEQPFNSCSGGQQKRVAIAQELMSLDCTPSLLLLDEPTTGLDSTATLVLVDCLLNLCKTHRIAIALSIHLPSDDVLNRFHQLYIMARGGLCIYSGPPSELRASLDYEVPTNTPPIEEWLRIGCRGISNPHVCELGQRTHSQVTDYLKPHLSELCHQPHGIWPRLKPFSFTDLLLQLTRLTRIIFVLDWRAQMFQLALILIWFLFLAFVFDPEMLLHTSCSPTNTSDEISNSTHCLASLRADSYVQSYLSYLLFVVLFLQMSVVIISAVIVNTGLKIYQHEFRNAWYSFSVLTTSFITVRLIENLLFALTTTAVFYFIVDHRLSDEGFFHWSRFAHFILFKVVFCVYFQSVGHLGGVIFLKQFELAFAFSALVSGLMIIANGLVMTVERMDRPLLIWISEAIGTIHIVKGMLWSFYGLDRCDSETEQSMVLLEYSVEQNSIYWDLWHPIANTILLRLVILAVLYFKLSYRKTVHLKAPKDLESITLDTKNQLVEFDVLNKEERSVPLDQQTQFCHGKLIIAWRHLSLFGSNSYLEQRSVVKSKSNEKFILRNITGSLEFGELTALMGSSGAGKTSLLKVLNGKFKANLAEETEFYLSRFVPISTCFVTQEVSDHLWPGLTVYQSLLYACKLKNCGEKSMDYDLTVSRLLDELQLSNVTDSPVQKCSGGERKRIALAQELTAKHMPNLVCVDEPTSGLDSNSADIVVACLHRLVRRHPITIVASVHQPSHAVLNHFDKIYAMARGGVCIFHGKPQQIGSHLANLSNLPQGYPLDELIRLASFGHEDPRIDQIRKYTWQVESTRLEEETRLIDTGLPSNQVQFSLHSVWVLVLRTVNYFRQYLWFLWIVQLVAYICFALCLRYFFNSRIALVSGCINIELEGYNPDDQAAQCSRSQKSIDDQSDVMNNFRYTYFVACNFLFMVTIQVGLTFLRDWPHRQLEQRNGWYSTGALYLTCSLTEMVLLVPLILGYALLTNIYESILPGYYWNYTLLLVLAMLALQPMAQAAALASKGHLHAFLLIVLFTFMLSMLLGSKLFAPLDYPNILLEWLAYLSIPRQVTDACLILQYGFKRCIDKIEMSGILYQMDIEEIEYHSSFYNSRLITLGFNIIFWRLIALAILFSRTKQRAQVEKIVPPEDKIKILSVPGLATYTEFRIRQVKL